MSKQFLVLSHIWSKIYVCSHSFCTCSAVSTIRTLCDFHNNFLKEFSIDLFRVILLCGTLTVIQYCIQEKSEKSL